MAAADAEAQSTPLPAAFTRMHSCGSRHFRRSATDAILFYSTHHCLTQKPSPSRAEQQGVSCYRANDYDGAIYHFSEALRFNPPDPAQVLGNRAAAFEKIGDFEAAAADAKEAIQHTPDYLKGYFRLATSLIELKRYNEALAASEDGLRRSPKNTQLLELREKAKAMAMEERLQQMRRQQQAANGGGDEDDEDDEDDEEEDDEEEEEDDDEEDDDAADDPDFERRDEKSPEDLDFERALSATMADAMAAGRRQPAASAAAADNMATPSMLRRFESPPKMLSRGGGGGPGPIAFKMLKRGARGKLEARDLFVPTETNFASQVLKNAAAREREARELKASTYHLASRQDDD